MRRRALLARTVLLITPIVGLAGCSGFGDGTETGTPNGTDSPQSTASSGPSPTPATARAEGELRVVEHALDWRNAGTDSELVAVEATVENRGSASVDVRAIARFLDDGVERLSEGEAETVDLAPNGTWTVELLFDGSGEAARAVAGYRLIVESR